MSELLPVLQQLVADAECGRGGALCTVVRTRGSTPQGPGASMLVRSDYSTLGTLGGGCVEAEVRRRAFELLQRRESSLLDFLLDHDYGWDDGLICGGRMEIAVAFVCDAAGLDEYRTAIECALRRQPASFSISVGQDGDAARFRVALEPPPTLLIAGAGHVGCALSRLMVDLGFRVVVLDDRAEFCVSERFDARVELHVGDIATGLAAWPLDAHCYVVIVTRGHQHDHQALHAVVQREAGYIGLIGSRRKREMIFRDLTASGVTAAQVGRVHSPVGLPIGAISVNEIAISIAAQLVQVRRQRHEPIVTAL